MEIERVQAGLGPTSNAKHIQIQEALGELGQSITKLKRLRAQIQGVEEPHQSQPAPPSLPLADLLGNLSTALREAAANINDLVNAMEADLF